jgi:hypothetical protein
MSKDTRIRISLAAYNYLWETSRRSGLSKIEIIDMALLQGVKPNKKNEKPKIEAISIKDKANKIHKKIKKSFKILSKKIHKSINHHIDLYYILTPLAVKKYLNNNNQILKMYYVFGIRVARIVK